MKRIQNRIGAFAGANKQLNARYTDYVNKGEKLSVLVPLKGLSEPISRHANTREVIKLDFAVFVLLFSIFKVGVNVLCTLIIAVLADYVKR
jgi:hypothetical protein